MNDIQLNPADLYAPSSSEKKQAVLMYMMVGLLLSVGKQEVSPYTYFHLKQAMGRIVLLVAVIFIDVILIILGMFLGFFSWLALLITLPVLIMGILCAKQAREGKYERSSTSSDRFFSFFAGLGTWVLNLFDANHYTTIGQESLDNNQEIPTSNQIDLSQYEMQSSLNQATNQENQQNSQSVSNETVQ